MNIFGGKVSVASVTGTGCPGVLWDPSYSGPSTLRKFLDSEEHLGWLKIDLNATEVITSQDYK